MSWLKFGDPYSIGQRDKARIRVRMNAMYSDRMIDKLLSSLDELDQFFRDERITRYDKQRRELILEWLEDCAEKRGES